MKCMNFELLWFVYAELVAGSSSCVLALKSKFGFPIRCDARISVIIFLTLICFENFKILYS